jgi:hypothetical protein
MNISQEAKIVRHPMSILTIDGKNGIETRVISQMPQGIYVNNRLYSYAEAIRKVNPLNQLHWPSDVHTHVHMNAVTAFLKTFEAACLKRDYILKEIIVNGNGYIFNFNLPNQSL